MSKLGRGYQIPLSWEKYSHGNIPRDAIDAGGGKFVGRILYQNKQLAGTVDRSKNTGFYVIGEYIHQEPNGEVLVDTRIKQDKTCWQWVKANHGKIPANAIVTGEYDGQDALVICRISINSQIVVGYAVHNRLLASFPLEGRAIHVYNCEVLCYVD